MPRKKMYYIVFATLLFPSALADMAKGYENAESFVNSIAFQVKKPHCLIDGGWAPGMGIEIVTANNTLINVPISVVVLDGNATEVGNAPLAFTNDTIGTKKLEYISAKDLGIVDDLFPERGRVQLLDKEGKIVNCVDFGSPEELQRQQPSSNCTSVDSDPLQPSTFYYLKLKSRNDNHIATGQFVHDFEWTNDIVDSGGGETDTPCLLGQANRNQTFVTGPHSASFINEISLNTLCGDTFAPLVEVFLAPGEGEVTLSMWNSLQHSTNRWFIHSRTEPQIKMFEFSKLSFDETGGIVALHWGHEEADGLIISSLAWGSTPMMDFNGNTPTLVPYTGGDAYELTNESIECGESSQRADHQWKATPYGKCTPNAPNNDQCLYIPPPANSTDAPRAPVTPPPSSESSGASNQWAIAGAAVGGLVLVGAAVAGIVFAVRKNTKYGFDDNDSDCAAPANYEAIIAAPMPLDDSETNIAVGLHNFL
eukprot:Selendium_serpulae@DN3684_c0_g1_i1.p1